MALQNFVDLVGPPVSAAWLNGVDVFWSTVFSNAQTNEAAQAALFAGGMVAPRATVGPGSVTTLTAEGLTILSDGVGASVDLISQWSANNSHVAALMKNYSSGVLALSVGLQIGNNLAGDELSLYKTSTGYTGPNPYSALTSASAGFDFGSTTPEFDFSWGAAPPYRFFKSGLLQMTRSLVVGAATGGDQGVGTGNFQNLFVNGVAVATTTPGANNFGYLNVPQNLQAGNYTCVLADSGKSVDNTGAAATTTIPANASVAYPLGTVLMGYNLSAGNQSVAITTDTMTLANSTTTGTRTVAQNGIWSARKVTSTSWIIGGPGVS
jgi:hypothetical protein